MHVVDYLRVAGTPNDLRVFAARSRRQKVDCTELLSFISDEKCKLRPGPYGCSHIITGSGFGAFRLPQNLGSGQRVEADPVILGVAGRLQNGRKDDK